MNDIILEEQHFPGSPELRYEKYKSIGLDLIKNNKGIVSLMQFAFLLWQEENHHVSIYNRNNNSHLNLHLGITALQKLLIALITSRSVMSLVREYAKIDQRQNSLSLSIYRQVKESWKLSLIDF